MVYAYNPSTQEREGTITLGYIVSLRPARLIRELVSKEEVGGREKLFFSKY